MKLGDKVICWPLDSVPYLAEIDEIISDGAFVRRLEDNELFACTFSRIQILKQESKENI